MKVKELIEKLQKLNPEKMVVLSGCEGGFNEATDIEEIKIKLNVYETWYYGKHERNKDGECQAVQIF